MVPLLKLFSGIQNVTFVCFKCGIKETKNVNEVKFKSFVKQFTTEEGKCISCNSELNLFRNTYGEQFWINNNK